MAIVYAEYRSTERISTSYLISSDLTLENKLYRCTYIRIN